jgi:maleate cis-trans isomerase
VLGYRARIGYTAPVSAVENFAHEFYRMVPEGVTLVVATAPTGLGEVSDNEFPLGVPRGKKTDAASEAVAREMAQAGVSIVVVGGASPAFGLDRLNQQARELEQEFGIQVTNTREAQLHALREVGARRIGLVTPGAITEQAGIDRFAADGFEVVGVAGAGYTYTDFGRCPTDAPAQVARRLVAAHPEADTVFFAAPHWPAASNVEVLEQEFGRNMITSTQAIVWEALRRCQINDSINGFGRLLREH